MTREGECADRALHFSTDSVPARDRLPYFREAFGRSTARVELAPAEGCPLGWSASMYSFDGLGVISAQTNGITCHRTRQLLSDGNDDFLLTANLSGTSLIFQAGRDCRLGPGDAALKSSCDVGGHDFPGPAQYLTLRIPRRRLNSMAVKPEDALARPIPAKTETLRLLVDYVKSALLNHPVTSPQLHQLFTTHVLDLVVLAVGATHDVSDVARRRGLPAARLNAIKSDIITGLGGERLDIAGIARGRGITPRYVQMLFESEGTTFTAYVLEQRLTRAHRMLTDRVFGHWTISAIAFEVGFENLSYFNRVFRRVFGATPSDIRAAARTAAS